MGIKKVRSPLVPLCGAVLIITALSLASTVTAEAPPPIVGTMIVSCTIQPTIEAHFPQGVSMEGLSPGGPYESLPMTISVRSNCPWVVKIKSDLPDGRMKEWNGSQYVTPGALLTQPFLWRVEGGQGTFVPLTSTEATVASGDGPTGDSPVRIDVNFTQTISFGDKALPAGSCYKGVVTFIASAIY